MKLTPLRIYAIKLAMFSTVLGYMALDLFVFEGPMHTFLHDRERLRTSELADSWSASQQSRTRWPDEWWMTRHGEPA